MMLEQGSTPTLLIGPFVDEADGFTAEVGLTISQADVRLSMNGGNMAQKTEATGCTHDELGYYTCPLDATDTGTLGILQVMVHEGGARPVLHEFMVVPSNVYDSLILGSDYLDIEVAAMAADTLTAAAVATNAIDAGAIADGAIDAATFAAGAIDAAAIETGAIDADAVADNAIDAGAIADGAIDAGAFAAGAIDAAAIADAAIDAATFAANAIAAAAIADGAIDAATFAAGAIDADATAADFIAEIKAQVVAALATDTYAEPGQGAPGTTPTIAEMQALMYFALINKGNGTSAIKRFFDNAGTTILWTKAASDDETTYEEETAISGT